MSAQKHNVVSYPMASATLACFGRYGALNAVESVEGETRLSPQVRALVSAAHHVLGGGRIAVRVMTPGRAEIVDELNSHARAAMDESNAINRDNGTYLTVNI